MIGVAMKPSVLVVGDLILDVDILCQPRGNAEGAALCLTGEEFVYHPGGAANVAVEASLTEGPGAVALKGIVGPDQESDMLLRCLPKFGVEVLACVQADFFMPLKLRAYAEGKIAARIDRELRHPSQCPTVVPCADTQARCVTFVDYAKGMFSEYQMDEVRRAIALPGVKTVVNPHPSNPVDWSGATVAVLNAAEHEAMGFIGARWTLVTHGSQGGTLYYGGQWAAGFAVEPVADPQVVGAGDCVTAHLAVGLAQGQSIPAAARAALTAASDYVKGAR
jgi:bifunctional ADP-heptose synthase (sugar kinase/adenylyltransferase)